MITLIVARARAGAIGRGGTMPWHLPEDLEFFRRETTRGAMIMGARTWASLPVRPLPDRLNIVVTSTADLTEHTAPGVDAAIAMARAAGYRRIYGMGGAQIYAEMLPLAERLVITDVNLGVPDADTFFPDIEEDDWTCQYETVLRQHPPICIARDLIRR